MTDGAVSEPICANSSGLAGTSESEPNTGEVSHVKGAAVALLPFVPDARPAAQQGTVSLKQERDYVTFVSLHDTYRL